ncbi:MAG: SDR family NAD(P)-dependent oxidoreductase [Bdellovibrionaceae bacterium]|nr:SDR family NAD(P)-dependent oxidoreductase [Pseudobdellovibrionaceae bacterium]
MEILNTTVLITGANRGIGRAVAEAFAAEGAHLVLAVRKPEKDLEDQLRARGAPSVRSMGVDLSSRASVSGFLEAISEMPVDILFNNAGLLTGGLLEEQPWPEIEAMLEVNVNAVIRITRAVLPGMLQRRRGKIVNNASVSALMHFPCASTYAASKAAVWAFTECLQAELKGTGVSALCLLTPGVKTRMYDQIRPLYEKNLDIPDGGALPAQEYAERVLEAIRRDEELLLPGGSTGLALAIARFLPPVFRRLAASRLRR